jgi:membrane protein implicated in regulation of membrane protease activity
VTVAVVLTVVAFLITIAFGMFFVLVVTVTVTFGMLVIFVVVAFAVVMFALAMSLVMVVRMFTGAAKQKQGGKEQSKKRFHNAGTVTAPQVFGKPQDS